MTYKVIRSRRRTISLCWKPDGTLEVRCPWGMSDGQVAEFVAGKQAWIEKHRPTEVPQPLTAGEDQYLRQKAKTVFPGRVAFFASVIGVSYGKITVRGQKTRWGSCSAGGNLNFNYLLLLAPPEMLDYVVIHELCHRKEMNHSERFWRLVQTHCPNYQACRKWLKVHGRQLLSRLPNP